MIERYALIIGAMKSGTTTLFYYLGQHPQVAAARNKEPGFFAFEETWCLGFQWFEQLFNFDPSRHRVALEASTDYTKYPFCSGVPERIVASAPRTFKLIYLLRHPLRRIESHARHVDQARKEVGQFPSPRAGHSLDHGISQVSLAASRYATQLDQFHEFHEAGRLLVLTMEELSQEPRLTLRRTCRFLEIDEDFSFDTTRTMNETASRQRIHPLWSALSGYASLRGIGKFLVPTSLRPKLKKLAMIPVVSVGRFDLREDEKAALLTALMPELRRLKTVYGVDVERWWGIAV